MSELKPNDPLVKEMLNDHLLVLVTKEAWILLNESRRTRPDLKAELVDDLFKVFRHVVNHYREDDKTIVLAMLDDIDKWKATYDRYGIEAINTIMGDTE